MDAGPHAPSGGGGVLLRRRREDKSGLARGASDEPVDVAASGLGLHRSGVEGAQHRCGDGTNGVLFDLLIVPLLLWRRTRALAFVAVVIFHASNAVLFKIGVFPFLMVALTTVFFSPHWCQRWTRREPAIAALPMGRWVVPVVLIWMLAQVVIPVRSVWMYGDPAWTEEGHRFSWRMKLRSKVGRVVFHALDKETGHHQVLDPKDSLTPYQARKMATRPRMILDFAHHLRDSLADQGSGRWAIHADARVSLNQRPVQSLIDPAADLAQVVPEAHPSWIVPLQE